VAALEDYAVVRDIVSDIVSEGVQATVSNTVRETVTNVEAILGETGQQFASVAEVRRRLGLDEGTTSRRVKAARSRGYLVNDEDRRGRPAKLKIGDPLPKEIAILPEPAVLSDRCSVASDPEGDR
jgi:hypothetical protein